MALQVFYRAHMTMEYEPVARDIPKEKIRTLLVDDSPRITELVAGHLGGHGAFEIVDVACNGREAIEKAARWRPDLVIMDIDMPELNGLEATRRIKDSATAGAVVMLSLHNNHSHRIAAERAGADGYCNKLDIHQKLVPTILSLFPAVE